MQFHISCVTHRAVPTQAFRPQPKEQRFEDEDISESCCRTICAPLASTDSIPLQNYREDSNFPLSAFKMPEERKAAMGQEPGLTTVCVFLCLKFVGSYLLSASKLQLIGGVSTWCVEEVYRIKVERKAALTHCLNLAVLECWKRH